VDDRRKLLEAFSSQLKGGDSRMDKFIDVSQSDLYRASDARDLAQEALANEVLKNTGVPIPGKGSSQSKVEDFYNRIIKERYPELEPDVQLRNLIQEGALGEYGDGKIGVDKQFSKQSLLGSVGTSLHEAGHQYDDQVLGKAGKNFQLEKFAAPAGADASEIYEKLAKGHHKTIPNLREGSYGLGALKSMLKSGTFKQVVGAAPLIGGGIAAAVSGDARAAVPFLGDSEDVGMSGADERAMLNEHDARVNYDKSAARADALRKLTGK
jgi:hypothetical protein